MFYTYPRSTVEIRQGNIFINLPFTDIDDLDKLVIGNDQGQSGESKTWEQVMGLPDATAKIKITKTPGIVISQNCDNLRNDSISFAMIQPLETVTNQRPDTKLNWAKLIIKGPIQSHYQWFYLPEDEKIGFKQKMVVNFDILFQIPKDSLLSRTKTMRKAALKPMALEHFRENLVKYFTRYAHNEWYSLSKEEFEAYKQAIVRKSPEEEVNIVPYDHQK